jgi:hypothetical protein
MSDEPRPPNSKRARFPVATVWERALVGAIVGFVVAGCVAIAFVSVGSEWLDASVAGGLIGLPIFFSIVRWQAVADFCAGLLEAIVIVLTVLSAALATLFGAV